MDHIWKEKFISEAIRNYITDFTQMKKDEYSDFTFCGASIGHDFEKYPHFILRFIPQLYTENISLSDVKDICVSQGCRPRNLDRRQHKNCCEKHIFPTRLINNFEQLDLKNHSRIYYNLNLEVLWTTYLKIKDPENKNLAEMMNQFTEFYSEVRSKDLVSTLE
jgi:hypothetical protein